MSNRKIPESIAALAEEFAGSISALYGARLDKVVLFGSYARGEQREDSDVDFLVVLRDQVVNSYHEIGIMSSVTFEISLKYDIAVSAIPMSIEKFDQKLSPLADNVHQDGIMV